MQKKVIPTKHGIKCSKCDVVDITRYCVYFHPYNRSLLFNTKYEAIDMINAALSDPSFSSVDFKLLKVQLLKF